MLANTLGYGVGFVARSYVGVTYIYTVRECLEGLIFRFAESRCGQTFGRLVSKQTSYVLAFPCVNLVGEVISLMVGSLTAYLIRYGTIRLWGKDKEGERPSYAAIVIGVCVAFIVKNVVAFHVLERLYNGIKEGATRITQVYLGKEAKMVFPISNAMGIHVATLAAFPTASLVGDGAGMIVKQGIYFSFRYLSPKSPPSQKPPEGKP